MDDNQTENVNNCIDIKLQGFYKVQVVDAKTGKIVRDYLEQKNLILNDGLNALPSYVIADLNFFGMAGTGSRPNSIDGGTSTITQSGNMIYLYGRTGIADFTSSYSTYTSAVEVGDILQYANLSESMVAQVYPDAADGFKLRVSESYNIPDTDEQTFTIWKTSQHGLEYEEKRASGNKPFIGKPADSDFLTSACTSSISHSTVFNRRVYDFARESSDKIYTEVGVSWAISGVNTTFARALLPAPVAVNAGQRLRLQHDLYSTFEPSEPVYFTASFLGWPGSGTTLYATQSIIMMWASTVTAGTGQTNGDSAVLEPKLGLKTWISSKSTSLAPIGTYDDRYVANETWLDTVSKVVTYVPNSFELYKSSSFTIYQCNITHLRSIGIGTGGNESYSSGQAITVLFDADQTKLDTQKMTICWKWNWGRVLS